MDRLGVFHHRWQPVVATFPSPPPPHASAWALAQVRPIPSPLSTPPLPPPAPPPHLPLCLSWRDLACRERRRAHFVLARARQGGPIFPLLQMWKLRLRVRQLVHQPCWLRSLGSWLVLNQRIHVLAPGTCLILWFWPNRHGTTGSGSGPPAPR